MYLSLPYQSSLRSPVDLGDFVDPAPSIGVFEREQVFGRPVKVISDIGYLLIELREGVAYDSPGCSGSTSNPCWQCGQTTFSARVPLPLMRL